MGIFILGFIIGFAVGFGAFVIWLTEPWKRWNWFKKKKVDNNKEV